jgi:enoyl-CoA hydratase/carnithine racemase
LVTQLAAETQAIAATARSEDAGEGLAAFLERRPSKFKGY